VLQGPRRGGIASLAGRSILTLSGGEWQRVLIARALAQDTEVLLLDEPTSHLDLSHQSEVLSLMHNLSSAGSTIIGVFHDLNLAALYCDRLIMLQDGRSSQTDRRHRSSRPKKYTKYTGQMLSLQSTLPPAGRSSCPSPFPAVEVHLFMAARYW